MDVRDHSDDIRDIIDDRYHSDDPMDIPDNRYHSRDFIDGRNHLSDTKYIKDGRDIMDDRDRMSIISDIWIRGTTGGAIQPRANLRLFVQTRLPGPWLPPRTIAAVAAAIAARPRTRPAAACSSWRLGAQGRQAAAAAPGNSVEEAPGGGGQAGLPRLGCVHCITLSRRSHCSR